MSPSTRLPMKFPTKNEKEKVYGRIASDCCP